MNPLRRLRQLGQSPWLDDLRRGMLLDGSFQRLMDEDGICGITSNPTILARALLETDDYREAIARLAGEYSDTEALYEALVLEDIRLAADLLRPVYDKTGGVDGYVSLEITPELANDTDGSVREAERLWQAIDRPNAMIKIPATAAGLPAIRTLVERGVNVNATLIFSPARYRQVAEAWAGGMQARIEAGQPVAQVASVASFFVSRIETLADQRLAALDDPRAKELQGQVAVAAAKLAYREFVDLQTRSPAFSAAAQAGAWLQRPLWASTSTKNPAYADIKYVEALIGPHTVVTLPPETLAAYRDHGNPQQRIEDGMAEAAAVFEQLAAVGIDFDELAGQLEAEGVEKFRASWQEIMAALDALRRG